MEKKNLWKAFFLILATLLGFGVGEITDDAILLPLLESPAPEPVTCPDTTVIAYTDNGKFFCECIGPDCECKNTEEILSQLG